MLDLGFSMSAVLVTLSGIVRSRKFLRQLSWSPRQALHAIAT